MEDGKFFISTAALIAILVACGFLYYLVLLGNFLPQLSSPSGVAVFAVLAALAFGTGQYILARFVAKKRLDPGFAGPASFGMMYRAVKMLFYATAAVVLAITIEAMTTSRYHVGLYVAATAASYMLGAVITGLLSYRFFSWYRSRRDATTLVFGASFAIAVSAFSVPALVNGTYFFSGDPLLTEGPNVWPDPGTPYYASLKKSDELFNVYQWTQNTIRVTFFALWASAVLLVRRYSRKIGVVRFWLVALVPSLAYVLVTMISLLELDSSAPLLAGLFIPAGGIGAGLLIGAIFITSARKMKQLGQGMMAHYLSITGLCFILGNAALMPSIHVVDRTHTAYPPFGVIAHSFAAFSVFRLSVGFYYSATLISRDVDLRKNLRKALAGESSKLLDNIGNAQMEQQLLKTVEKVAKEQEDALREQTGISQQVSEEEMRQYMKEVVDELEKTRGRA